VGILGFRQAAKKKRSSRREGKTCFWVLWVVSSGQEAREVERKKKKEENEKHQTIPGEIEESRRREE